MQSLFKLSASRHQSAIEQKIARLREQGDDASRQIGFLGERLEDLTKMRCLKDTITTGLRITPLKSKKGFFVSKRTFELEETLKALEIDVAVKEETIKNLHQSIFWYNKRTDLTRNTNRLAAAGSEAPNEWDVFAWGRDVHAPEADRQVLEAEAGDEKGVGYEVEKEGDMDLEHFIGIRQVAPIRGEVPIQKRRQRNQIWRNGLVDKLQRWFHAKRLSTTPAVGFCAYADVEFTYASGGGAGPNGYDRSPQKMHRLTKEDLDRLAKEDEQFLLVQEYRELFGISCDGGSTRHRRARRHELAEDTVAEKVNQRGWEGGEHFGTDSAVCGDTLEYDLEYYMSLPLPEIDADCL
ncbi:hypothetical protein HDU98_008332 [Podochytrium sp. JEL0797]|nr:hypothetical protein HDU98_008332 [Podochytrium sp. JEL0797]